MRERTDRRGSRRGERGTAMITALVALVAMLGAGALAVDAGLVWVARTQLQNVADSAALAGAAELIELPGLVVTRDEATTAVDTYAATNHSIHDGITILAGDIEFGDWDQVTETFTTPVDETDPTVNTAVRVTARMDGVANDPVRAFLARVLGRTSFQVTATATAYMGYAGTVGPGSIDLPIAIDCCKIAGPDCAADYCDWIEANQPNPCTISEEFAAHGGDTNVTCLEFHNTDQQNACWTELDGDASSVNTAELLDLIDGTDPMPEVGYEPVYTDNGDKTPVIREIYNRMHGIDEYAPDGPDGSDWYDPKDGVMDSWVVGLPVVECQTDDHCAGGDAHNIVGFVCFEIREIIVTPDKIIKGRFLCPEKHPDLWKKCDIGPGGTGGLNFGLRSEIPVLVQ